MTKNPDKLYTKDQLAAAFDKKLHRKGEQKCPCCKIVVKLTPRKIDSTMVRTLILMATQGDDWIHVRRFCEANGFKSLSRGGSYSKLAHWGMMESKKFGSGIWRVTSKGHAFATGRRKTWAQALIKNRDKEFIGFIREAGRVTVGEALGAKFDLAEVRRGVKNVRSA